MGGLSRQLVQMPVQFPPAPTAEEFGKLRTLAPGLTPTRLEATHFLQRRTVCFTYRYEWHWVLISIVDWSVRTTLNDSTLDTRHDESEIHSGASPTFNEEPSMLGASCTSDAEPWNPCNPCSEDRSSGMPLLPSAKRRACTRSLLAFRPMFRRSARQEQPRTRVL